MAKAVVEFSMYGYLDSDGAVQRAKKGETVDVTDAQLKAGIEEGSLRKPGAKKPADADPDGAEAPAAPPSKPDPDATP